MRNGLSVVARVSTRLRLIRRRKLAQAGRFAVYEEVSTRLRLIRRRKRRQPDGWRQPDGCFNPPPAHPPEETSPQPALYLPVAVFQPASGSSAGGNLPGWELK